MKMIWRGSKANEHVLAVGEATEGARTKIQKKKTSHIRNLLEFFSSLQKHK